MYFTTLKPMDTNCPIIGPLYVQCQTVKKLEIHCSSVRHWNKTLPGYILIVGILQILLNALNSIRLTKGICPRVLLAALATFWPLTATHSTTDIGIIERAQSDGDTIEKSGNQRPVSVRWPTREVKTRRTSTTTGQKPCKHPIRTARKTTTNRDGNPAHPHQDPR